MLAISNLTKRFDKDHPPILNDLSLTIPTGESASIRGASGCGKSTLLSLIAGFEQADSGQIQVDNHVLSNASEKHADNFRRQHLGVIFQSYNLLPCLNVFDNIAFPPRLKQNYDENFVTALLETLEISHLRDKNVTVLSGGEQQRVAIARSLAHKPSLILADEPTGNLDEATSATVSNVLFDTCTLFNTTLVVVTHSNEIAEKAKHQLLLSNGQLFQCT